MRRRLSSALKIVFQADQHALLFRLGGHVLEYAHEAVDLGRLGHIEVAGIEAGGHGERKPQGLAHVDAIGQPLGCAGITQQRDVIELANGQRGNFQTASLGRFPVGFLHLGLAEVHGVGGGA